MKKIPRISLYHKPIKAYGKGKKKEEQKYDEFEDDKLFMKKEIPKKLHHDKDFQAAKDLDDQILYISDPEQMISFDSRNKVRKINISKLKPLKQHEILECMAKERDIIVMKIMNPGLGKTAAWFNNPSSKALSAAIEF